MSNNFRGDIPEFGFWDRLTTGLGGAIGALGGAFSVLAKLDRLKDKLKTIVQAKKAQKKAAVLEAARDLEKRVPASPPLCLAAGTLVLLGTAAAAMPIEDVHLGQCLPCVEERATLGLGEELDLASPDAWSRIDPERWCRVDLVLTGSGGSEASVSLLRPRVWLESLGADVGSEIRLRIPDTSVYGHALVTGVGPCPESVREGRPGYRPVIGVFRNLAPEVCRVEFEGGESALVGTAAHNVFSLTRNGWVELGDLLPGERVRTATGAATVSRSRPQATPQAVFNLEVHRGHTYFAGGEAVLVHNNNPCAVGGGGNGLTTPGKLFGDKTAKEASDALGTKFGPPRSSRPGAETFYNPKTGRSYNVHTDPAHGPPHVDIRTRGAIPDRKVSIQGGGN